MKNIGKRMIAVWLVGLLQGLALSAQAASGAGPYYAVPSWDQTLPTETRFIILTNMNSEAVLDRETGLVWDRSPADSRVDWATAWGTCINLIRGGRAGWRLPTVQEFLSLIEPVPFSTPQGTLIRASLPAGHPFAGITNNAFWTLTQVGAGGHIGVFLGNPFPVTANLVGSGRFWCVRSPQGESSQ